MLAEINFAEKSAENIQNNIILTYESIANRSLAPADPIRLFLKSIATIIAQQRVVIDYAAKQNLVAYANGLSLEHLGLLVGASRLQASAAYTTIKFTLSEIRQQATLIPANTKVTAGDNIFFATTENKIIEPNTLIVEVAAKCIQLGTIGNGYTAGQVNKMVDRLPFVDSIVNTTTSEGGADIESDDEYRERIQLAPEQFSTAGPDGAYIYHALKASALIADISIYSPVAGTVEIIPLLKDGQIPGQDILKLVYQACNDKNVRPLTDLVVVNAPTIVDYKISLTYYISKKNQTNIIIIKSAIEKSIADFILWQKSKLGRDINNSELTKVIVNAGAKRVEILSPSYTTITYNQVAVADDDSVINFGGVEDD